MTRRGASDTISLPARQTRGTRKRGETERENLLLADRRRSPLEHTRSRDQVKRPRTWSSSLERNVNLQSALAKLKSRIVSREIAAYNSHAPRLRGSNIYYLLICCAPPFSLPINCSRFVSFPLQNKPAKTLQNITVMFQQLCSNDKVSASGILIRNAATLMFQR